MMQGSRDSKGCQSSLDAPGRRHVNVHMSEASYSIKSVVYGYRF